MGLKFKFLSRKHMGDVTQFPRQAHVSSPPSGAVGGQERDSSSEAGLLLIRGRRRCCSALRVLPRALFPGKDSKESRCSRPGLDEVIVGAGGGYTDSLGDTSAPGEVNEKPERKVKNKSPQGERMQQENQHTRHFPTVGSGRSARCHPDSQRDEGRENHLETAAGKSAPSHNALLCLKKGKGFVSIYP